MKRLALPCCLVASLAFAGDLLFRTDNVTRGPVQSINLLIDGGLTGHRDAGAVAHLECAIATNNTRGCVEPGAAQTFSGQKTFSGGVQPVCVTHASLTACTGGNAGLHQCCSTHGNAIVHCNGTTNVELTGANAASSLPPVYVNGLLHSGALFLSAWTLPYAYTITNFSGFIAPGAGTTQNLRFTDGTNNCDCEIDCTLGGTNFACAGNCTFASSTLVVSIIDSDGCTTPTTVKGILTPAGYR